MKQVPTSEVGSIVAYRWPQWKHHFTIEPGEWLLSTWRGETRTFWVKFNLDAPNFMDRDVCKDAMLLEPGESKNLVDKDGWVIVLAFHEKGAA